MMSRERVFTMDLTPNGHDACVLLDGEDISSMLRGVVVSCLVGMATEVTLLPAKGQRATLMVRLPESHVIIGMEPRED